jgi:D-glycero-D-manno-heptose 1,7-bisphosphate phosphatase
MQPTFHKSHSVETAEKSMTQPPQRYVLLDRDGVINRRVAGGCVTNWDQFEFLPRALNALRLLAQHGYAAIVISKQAGVGKGLMTVAALESITRRFLTEVALAGGNIQQVYYCVHVPGDGCRCQQRESGIIRRAQLDYSFAPATTYFVGAALDDLRAASTAGCPAKLLRRDAFLEKHPADEPTLEVACDLYEAASLIVAPQAGNPSWQRNPVPRAQAAPFLQLDRG